MNRDVECMICERCGEFRWCKEFAGEWTCQKCSTLEEIKMWENALDKETIDGIMEL